MMGYVGLSAAEDVRCECGSWLAQCVAVMRGEAKLECYGCGDMYWAPIAHRRWYASRSEDRPVGEVHVGDRVFNRWSFRRDEQEWGTVADVFHGPRGLSYLRFVSGAMVLVDESEVARVLPMVEVG